MNIYDPGDLVRVSVTFASSGGTPVDPGSLYIGLKTPTAIESRGFGPDDRVVKESTGRYYFDISADLPGDYKYRWSSTGSVQAAVVGAFRVKEWPV
jgi:hypothetical protein